MIVQKYFNIIRTLTSRLVTPKYQVATIPEPPVRSEEYFLGGESKPYIALNQSGSSRFE